MEKINEAKILMQARSLGLATAAATAAAGMTPEQRCEAGAAVRALREQARKQPQSAWSWDFADGHDIGFDPGPIAIAAWFESRRSNERVRVYFTPGEECLTGDEWYPRAYGLTTSSGRRLTLSEFRELGRLGQCQELYDCAALHLPTIAHVERDDVDPWEPEVPRMTAWLSDGNPIDIDDPESASSTAYDFGGYTRYLTAEEVDLIADEVQDAIQDAIDQLQDKINDWENLKF